jgi:hypothetical protein
MWIEAGRALVGCTMTTQLWASVKWQILACDASAGGLGLAQMANAKPLNAQGLL